MKPHTAWKSRPLGAPRALQPWLTDNHSLTARIQARCQKFAVQRLVTRPLAFPDEGDCIGIPSRARAWVREVLLYADGVAVVFAHSIATLDDVRGAWRLARGVGGKPLGAALFADPRICRSNLVSRRLNQHHPLQRRAETVLATPLPALWARRSLFWRCNAPLLVTEVFLPALLSLRQ